jgi:antitoxin YefM
LRGTVAVGGTYKDSGERPRISDCLDSGPSQTIILVMTTTSLATVKAQLSAFVDSVHGTHERVVITRNGEPAAVLISPDDLQSLEETIAILSDPQAMAEINEARAAIERGDVVSSTDVRMRSTT